MGVHGNAEKIVREHGYDPKQAHVTTQANLGISGKANRADDAVAALSELMTTEGLVRVYALLKSAMETRTPKFDIGTGGKVLVTAIEKKLGPSKQEKETLARIDNMRKELDELAKQVKERAPA